jgi:hypothetical protein
MFSRNYKAVKNILDEKKLTKSSYKWYFDFKMSTSIMHPHISKDTAVCGIDF